MPVRPLLLLAFLSATGCQITATPRWDPASGRPLPARVQLGITGRAQQRSLSCESRSAVDLLAAYGRPTDEDAFRLGLPVSDNPDLGFVGDVNGPGEHLPPAGYGVHAEPIAARLTALGVPARAWGGRDLDWLRSQIAQGKPVIVWATGQLDAPQPVVMRDRSGRTFTAVRGEHTYLAVGYGPGSLTLIDAATGAEKDVFPRHFDASWSTLGRQAAVAHDPPSRGTSNRSR